MSELVVLPCMCFVFLPEYKFLFILQVTQELADSKSE